MNMCNVVPDGIICFFPSYSYEETVYNFWQKNGFITSIERKKKVSYSKLKTQHTQFFREPKSSQEVDKVLNDYKRTIDNNYPRSDKSSMYFKGALLSCVVGGKMSEGINFSDGYGRYTKFSISNHF